MQGTGQHKQPGKCYEKSADSDMYFAEWGEETRTHLAAVKFMFNGT